MKIMENNDMPVFQTRLIEPFRWTWLRHRIRQCIHLAAWITGEKVGFCNIFCVVPVKCLRFPNVWLQKRRKEWPISYEEPRLSNDFLIKIESSRLWSLSSTLYSLYLCYRMYIIYYLSLLVCSQCKYSVHSLPFFSGWRIHSFLM